MKKCVAIIAVLAGALLAFLPGISEAGRSLNHNETLLRG
jgi:TctA family transporter